jgi:hypothetical protein
MDNVLVSTMCVSTEFSKRVPLPVQERDTPQMSFDPETDVRLVCVRAWFSCAYKRLSMLR